MGCSKHLLGARPAHHPVGWSGQDPWEGSRRLPCPLACGSGKTQAGAPGPRLHRCGQQGLGEVTSLLPEACLFPFRVLFLEETVWTPCILAVTGEGGHGGATLRGSSLSSRHNPILKPTWGLSLRAPATLAFCRLPLDQAVPSSPRAVPSSPRAVSTQALPSRLEVLRVPEIWHVPRLALLCSFGCLPPCCPVSCIRTGTCPQPSQDPQALHLQSARAGCAVHAPRPGLMRVCSSGAGPCLLGPCSHNSSPDVPGGGLAMLGDLGAAGRQL